MILDCIFAILRQYAPVDQFKTHLNKLNDILDAFFIVKDMMLDPNEYQIPDFDPNSLQEKAYIEKVNLNGDISVKMTQQESLDLISKDPMLSTAVTAALSLASHKYAILNRFPNQVEYIFQDPNNLYAIRTPEEYNMKTFMYTDGQVEVTDPLQDQIRISDATYTITGVSINGVPMYAKLVSLDLAFESIDFYIEELHNIFNGGQLDYQIATGSPTVYKRRVH